MEISETFFLKSLENLKRDILSSLHAVMPGNIVSFDASTGLATVQPGLRAKNHSGRILTAPELYEVPVMRPSANFTVVDGSPCILIFSDYCLDGWLATNQPVLPPSPRCHDLSDAIALVGYFGPASSL